MTTVIASVVFIILGLYLALLSQKLSEWTVSWNYNVDRFKCNKEVCKLTFLVGGVISVVMGILGLLNVINFEGR